MLFRSALEVDECFLSFWRPLEPICLLHQLIKRERFFAQLADKSAECSYSPRELLTIYPFYGINPARAENPFFFLYLFQDLNDVIMSYKFRRVIILEGEDLGAK